MMRNFSIWFQIFFQVLLPAMMPCYVYSAPGTVAIAQSPVPYSQSLQTLAGRMADDGPAGLRSEAGDKVINATAATANAWLNKFGTAQVELNSGGIGGSAVDFLVPLYDNKKTVLFTQLGLRTPDDRVTGNLGLGGRIMVTPDWMLGGNFFVDDDMSGENHRVGIGAEAWTDAVRLSANTYLGTTEWHGSRDFDDYSEKPADGFDLRAEGYLPECPQLGARLMYEQYYGENVALFDKDHLQENPSAVTVGLRYSPVPLVSAGVDYRRGQDSVDDTRITLALRYSFGQSWQSQISAQEVEAEHLLGGNRYNLVDRNNEIVLQYRKEKPPTELADITLTSLRDNSPADGSAFNTVTAHAVTQEGKPAANVRVSWSVTGGAKLGSVSGVTDANGNLSVDLTSSHAGQFTVTATSGAVTRTTVSSFALYVSSLNLTLTKNNSQADGHEQNVGQVILKDVNGNVLQGVPVSWQVDKGATIVSNDAATDSNGKAVIRFSSTTAGQVKLSAIAQDQSASVNAAFIVGTISGVSVSTHTGSVLADGRSEAEVQAVITGADSQRLANVSVTWAIGGSAHATTPVTVTTNASGIATLKLTDTVAEGVTVTARAGDVSDQATVSFTVVVVDSIFVQMTTNDAPADNSSSDIAEAMVKDAHQQPIPNIQVTWAIPDSLTASFSSVSTVSTDSRGIATVSLKDSVTETVTLTASAGGQQDETSARFTQRVARHLELSAPVDNAIADGVAVNTLRAKVSDDGGVPIENASVTWNLGGSTAASFTTENHVQTDKDGYATVNLVDSVAESVTVLASADGLANKLSVTFTPAPATAAGH
ncbi:hypothetical protein HAX39_24970 [Citrobacter freundii]|nr:hypothetical protein [Citrobacter freundii]